jgi:LmbE family N-acetylglucosaminyl deacetylase
MSLAVLQPRSHVVVISPHCDDAVYSLGALISAHVHAGGSLTVVTVLAGDPSSDAAPGAWDAKAGFVDEGQAARVRRAEDRAACRLLGASWVHLDDVDEQYPRRLSDDALWARLAPHLDGADELLVPGGPLQHADHRMVADLVLSRRPTTGSLRLYREEPYASRTAVDRDFDPPALGSDATWTRLRASTRDAVVKARACSRYETQNPHLLAPGRRRRLVGLPRMLAWSAYRRGEAVTQPQGEAPAEAR